MATTTGKINCFLILNGIHTKWLDLVFAGLTFLGDGLFSVVTAILLFIAKQRRLSLYIMVTYLVSGIAAQVLKRMFMAPRPKEIINNHLYPFFLNGISGTGWDSFPSGHTTSVFALATMLALFSDKKYWGLFFLMMAILTGYSRIYLGQHFPGDVLAGALLGTVTGLLVYTFVHFPGKYFKAGYTSTAEPKQNPYASGLAGN